jgi:hypothetical protein
MSTAGNSNIATIVGSDKGGVGKSLISSLLIEAYDQARRPLSVVEVDHQGKLRNTMGNRVDLSLRASAELGDVTRDRTSAERFYNPVYDIWERHDSLTDLGANVTTFLFDWMKQCHIRELAVEDGIHFRFVAVTTPDDQALCSAFNAISTAVEALESDAEQFLVLNEIAQGSGFTHYENHQVFRELQQLGSSVNLKIVKIPYCDSDLMEYGRAHALSPLTVFKNTDRLCEEMELTRVAARTERRRLLAWISEVQENLEPLFVPYRKGSSDPEPRVDPVRVEAPRRDFRVSETASSAPRQSRPNYARGEAFHEERAPARASAVRMTEAGALVEHLHSNEDDAGAVLRSPLRPVATGGRFDYRG